MIDVQDLTVRIAHRTILTDVTFSIPDGSFLAVIGPNGGGKSTLIRALLGLQKYEGSIQFNPNNATIGYVPQIKTLDRSFPARAGELVATALKGRWPWSLDDGSRSTVLGALEKVGVDHLMNEQIRNLSGGELQRVYLARAMISDPHFLILDEPSAGVDLAGAADMLECVERFRQEHQATVVMVTHDWDVAAHHASHALVLKSRVLSFGTAQEAVTEDAVRLAFGHVGHAHGVLGGGHQHD
ncbi:MAG: metal ABC transporter ATP-binding protein [Bacteroidetes bacterium]|nr:metal ABC transporter ATP-binding protein [Bacteroidota bacterium]